MKNIAIETINDNNNYGNRLQNYAVQEVLKQLDNEVVTINNKYFPKKSKDNIVIKILKKIYHMCKKIIRIFFKNKNLELRKKCFEEFNKNIKFTDYTISEKDNSALKNQNYDFYVVGSDQVWNVNFNTYSKNSLLTFAEPEKRISFSASFGNSELPKEYHEEFGKELQKFKAISVRENAGKKIVEDLIQRNDVEVLVDPTMLLNDEQWDKVLRKPEQIKNDKYILNYFLGELPVEWKNEIDRIAAENNCKVINILDENEEMYGTGPSEFLYLEKNAFMVCTDSFHSTVFSVIYDTPFIVFDRKDKHVSMNSRIDTLLSKFNLQNRRFQGKISDELLKCDYSEAKNILLQEREKSINFLKRALDII